MHSWLSGTNPLYRDFKTGIQYLQEKRKKKNAPFIPLHRIEELHHGLI